jgi:hypothetical protein
MTGAYPLIVLDQEVAFWSVPAYPLEPDPWLQGNRHDNGPGNLTKISPLKFSSCTQDLFQVRPGKVAVDDAGSREISMGKVGRCQIALNEVRVFQMSIFEIGKVETGIFERSLLEMSPLEVCPSEVCRYECGLFEASPFEMSLFQMGTVEHGIFQVSMF